MQELWICITGATGFLGSHLVKYLMRSTKLIFNTGYHLDCLANLKEDSCLYIVKEPFVLNKPPSVNAWNKCNKNSLLYSLEQCELYEKSNLARELKQELTEIYASFVINKIVNLQIKKRLSKNELNEFIQKVLSINFKQDLKKNLIKLLKARVYCIFYATQYKKKVCKRDFLSRIIEILKIYNKSDKYLFKGISIWQSLCCKISED